MKKQIVALGVAVVLAASATFTGCGIVKVVKIGEEGKYTGEVEFNAGDDVAAIWESSALPELNEKAMDLKEFLTQSTEISQPWLRSMENIPWELPVN